MNYMEVKSTIVFSWLKNNNNRLIMVFSIIEYVALVLDVSVCTVRLHHRAGSNPLDGSNLMLVFYMVFALSGSSTHTLYVNDHFSFLVCIISKE